MRSSKVQKRDHEHDLHQTRSGMLAIRSERRLRPTEFTPISPYERRETSCQDEATKYRASRAATTSSIPSHLQHHLDVYMSSNLNPQFASLACDVDRASVDHFPAS